MSAMSGHQSRTTPPRINTRLLNRQVETREGRTSMKLEPELWDALRDICRRENCTLNELVDRVWAARPAGTRTGAMRVYIVQYYRARAAA
jgi:predicted DNA-binding ribbon-helix-helix protein